ncbi:MAG: hypothetical protein V3T16_11060 [Gemmatimonadales bacterium]
MTLHTEYLVDNIGLLHNGIEAIATMGSDLYAGRAGTPGVSPIGGHFRHVFDHYHAFLDGLPAGQVNYDARERDVRVEQDASRATGVAEDLARSIGTIAADDLNSPIRVSANQLVEGKSVTDWTGSTVQRELMYLLSHTVHHYAIISLLALQSGVKLDAEFGVAPSTLAYRRQRTACAPSAG